jgi:hypothetical protein
VSRRFESCRGHHRWAATSPPLALLLVDARLYGGTAHNPRTIFVEGIDRPRSFRDDTQRNRLGTKQHKGTLGTAHYGGAFRGARPRKEVKASNQAVIGVALLLWLLVVLVLAIKTT